MSVFGLLLLILIVLAIAGVPVWPYSRAWGHGPIGAVVAVILLLIVLHYVFRVV